VSVAREPPGDYQATGTPISGSPEARRVASCINFFWPCCGMMLSRQLTLEKPRHLSMEPTITINRASACVTRCWKSLGFGLSRTAIHDMRQRVAICRSVAALPQLKTLLAFVSHDYRY
jgi:hypothetical protein